MSHTPTHETGMSRDRENSMQRFCLSPFRRPLPAPAISDCIPRRSSRRIQTLCIPSSSHGAMQRARRAELMQFCGVASNSAEMPLQEENLAMEEHVGMEVASSFSESVLTNKSLGFLLFLLLMSSIYYNQQTTYFRAVSETNFQCVHAYFHG